MALSLASVIVSARPAPARSDPGTSPWVSPSAIATGLSEAKRPSLAFTADGVEHALWEKEGKIYSAAQTPGFGWSSPREIASGISPVLITDDLGKLHAVFVNQFMGNYEIYHITMGYSGWSLPVNVSHTSGFSAYPTAITGNAGALHVAWMDNSPGYWTIYVGTWNGIYWSNQPVANARGQAPTLGLSPDGILYLAWQDRVPTLENPSGTYHIFFSERVNGVWALPVDVSDRQQVESIGANLATTSDGLAHLTWVDDDQEVRYGFGQGSYWSVPVTVTRAVALARGPRILTEYSVRLHIAWDEGDMVRVTSAAPMTENWPKPTVIAEPLDNLSDVVLTLGPGNGVSLGWIRTHQPQDVGIYESWRATNLTRRAWLPLIMR